MTAITPAKKQNNLFGSPDSQLAELNDEQRAAVTSGDGPSLVLAGAGSGKTRVIVYRVAHLIQGGVAPEDILLLTFTNKAAAEMMGRIAKLLGESDCIKAGRVGRVTGGTFHSVANRLLREYAPALGYSRRFTIIDTDDQKSLIKSIIRERGLNDKERKFPSAAVVQGILSYRTNAMRPLPEVIARKYPKFEHLIADLEQVAGAYENRKRVADAMDFDDLLLRLYELLDGDPIARETLGRRFRYILVDEYQDTNPLQAAIVRLVSGGCGNVLVVGADVRNILDFSRQYPGASVYKLETNYRSSEEILDLANDVISHNANQYPKELRSVQGRSAKPRVVPAASASEEARFVASRVEELLDAGTSPGEIAILFRATHHSQALEFELMKSGVEYDYRGGVKFFERAHVKDVISFVRIAVNFRDEAAWLRAMSLQKGVGDKTAAKLFAMLMEAGSLASAILSPIEAKIGSRAAKGWSDLRACLEAAHRADGNPAEIIRSVRQVFYKDYLENEYPDAMERLGDIKALEEFAAGYESSDELLAEMTLDDSAYRNVADRRARQRGSLNKVVLSTVHQAKGLEWDAVFLVHVNDSGFPNARAAEEEDGLEEERRLFYVAVTRARRELTMSYPMTASFGGYSFEMMSRFLSEADPSLIDWSLYEERMGAKTVRSYGAAGHSPFGSSIKRALAASADEFSAGDFYEEPSIQAEDGEEEGDDWRNKSFLGGI
jgi:DNA helicase-2/ATP-dependent DNA helicase PcrA